MWELRKEKQLAPVQNADSGYRDIQRVKRNFNPLRVPTRLQESLPFESKEKVRTISAKERIRRMESKLPVKSMLTEKEKEVYSMI